ncbi:TetR/AcrR family transcriptional regulator [Neobacillus vireti]|uniref:HTH-type transcriptional regulator n=1 Tax=Neobacillus vireti LMG 21834 TaxID=1131730 RepID=A0AB94IHS3_9BACI|nr:TetR/AcrR family transcriptional regulator [Neobacillus vireti]ETI66596.1 HTH-type transcriptional regulator [Neobacillus vireti LMG 21834]KLT16735.1 transcriptional regulator [Neobacillus vireti]
MLKKQLIMERALELFARHGFEATSVQQITEHCGISKGAFYLSFKSKDELIIALIDHFMMQITSEIDHIVRNTKDDEQLLYHFYYAIYHSFHKHSDFAKVLIKEQSQTFNKELILKMQYYDKLTENTILSMIERLYGEEVKQTKYDLMYCIKGFMNTYSQLFVFYNVPLDLKLLAESLVEKTNLLARHTTVPFISQELIEIVKQPMNGEITKEQILEIIRQRIEEIEEPIEKESLILLQGQLLEPTLPPVIVKGLLENIRNHPHCKWISYLLRRYYNF